MRADIYFFTKVDSDFRETISWLALFFLCRGILSLLIIEGLCRKYPENTFLMSKCFSSNLFWWRDIHFWLENVYLVCGHWHRIPSFSPESNVFWISTIFLWVLALFVVSANYSKPDGTLIETFWLEGVPCTCSTELLNWFRCWDAQFLPLAKLFY